MRLTKKIQAFCDPSPSRCDLALPFRSGRYVVATNGWALVACKPSLYKGKLADGNANLPDPKPFLRFPSRIPWLQCRPRPPKCDDCNGTGSIPQTCATCSQAIPGIPCEGCRVREFRRWLRWHRVLLFQSFPDCEWGAPIEGENIADEPVWFRFTGGRGALKPIAVDDEATDDGRRTDDGQT